ncbi:hypothetical protein GCM10010387_59070 [Streptomyces inusitatus]|uniref:Tat pathway signal sequence domain protein n=1 Tax=Streptomyces inusitatus TaxID=68221 RepID=A0A918QLE9_9ACTN|nr:DUF4429 domain-containing protein [Streptomyces inusitatus]GGZ57291.1 hypothetical protein GCM10010387_59070 [Streptomyces inusitatus]
MAEIIQKDGTWTFDGETVRVVPGSDKSVGALRRSLGELAVPLAALAGISYEPGRKSGRLRLRLREGADPLLQITRDKLDESSDPYRLTVENDRTGVAEYFVDAVRNALLLEQIPAGRIDRYLMPGPALPVTASAGDGTAAFDGERIRLSWNWKTEESKASGGERTFALADVEAVEWLPSSGLENGALRFGLTRTPTKAPAKYDPYSVELWGFRKDPLMALVAAAVVARMPHPYAQAAPPPAAPAAAAAPGSPPSGGGDQDALLRRLRELGELRQSGILTEEEFSTAKQAILRQL